jgi:hypothetical protein
VIRFIDLSEAYWTDPEENGGPVCAFLDTRTDRFVTNGAHVFFDAVDLDDIAEAHMRERCREHVPDGFWERRSAPDGEMAVETGEEEA